MMETPIKTRARRLAPTARMAHRSKPVDTENRSADRMPVALNTASYSTFEPSQGVAVRTSLGTPKWPLGYEIEAAVREVMPVGLLDATLDEIAFETAYWQRLDRIGVDQIRRRFEQIASEHDGRPLVLLCFEPVGRYCHRHAFAAWWQKRTGQVVAEVPNRQLSLDLGGTA